MAAVIQVQDQMDTVQFEHVDVVDVAFSEAWLQDVLRRNPEVLPVEEFGPVFHPLVPIGKEVPTDAGSIDNLFISHAGYLVLVETKLWSNREARREVFAQLIDYASALSRMTYDELDARARDYLERYEGVTMTLQEWVEARIEPVDIGFQRRVTRNLKFGRVLQLIVTDHARPALVDMLVRVKNLHPSLAMDIGIVELRPFKRVGTPDPGILLVPYVPGRTEIVERSVVEVTVPGFPAAQVSARQDRSGGDEDGRHRRIPLTSLDAFWELMKEQSPEVEHVARRLFEALQNDQKVGLGLRESSIMVEAGVPGTGGSISLFFLKANGKLACWTQTIRRQARDAGLPDGLVEAYVARMRALFAAPPNRYELYRRIDEVDVDLLREAVTGFVTQIEEAS